MINSSGVDFKYWAFMSYSSKDREHAVWLSKQIEAYRIPSNLVGLNTPSGPVPRRVYPVFRDRDELRAGPDLQAALEEALRASRYQIVVCSPNSASDSSWVNKEIEYFKALPQGANVVPIIVAGEPNATLNGKPELECFPEALRRSKDTGPDGASSPPEPLAADLHREDQNERVSRRKALLKIIARMIDVNFDDLMQRDRKRRRQQMLLWGLTFLLVSTLILTAVVRWYFESTDNSAKSMARVAKQLLAQDPELSALLSLRSYALSPSAAAYDSLVSVATGKPHFQSIAFRGRQVRAAALDGEDGRIAVASCTEPQCRRYQLSLIDLNGMNPTGSPATLDADDIKAIDFHPQENGFYVTASHGDHDSVYFYRYNSQGIVAEPETFWSYNNLVSAITVNVADGLTAIAYGKWGKKFGYAKVQILNSNRVPVCTQEFRAKIKMTAFSLDSRWLAVLEDNRVHLIALNSCKAMSPAEFTMHRSGALSFSPSGDLYSVALDGFIYRLDPDEKRSTTIGIPSDYTHEGYSHRLSLNTNYLASKGGDGISIHLYDLQHYLELKNNLSALNKEGSIYAYIAERDFDAYKGHPLTIGNATLSGFGFSPSGKSLYGIYDENMVAVWRTQPYTMNERVTLTEPLPACSDVDCEDDTATQDAFEITDPGQNHLIRLDTKLTECGGDKKHDCLLVSTVTIYDIETALTVHRIDYTERTPPLLDPRVNLSYDSEGKLLVDNGVSVRKFHLDLNTLLKRVCTMAGDRRRMKETDRFLDPSISVLSPYIQPNSNLCN